MRKNKEIAQDCETCTNHGTMDCPTSALCYSKQNHPYWMNKPMKENRVKIAISDIPLDRLEAICAAEKDGQCVVLPCKVGDTVYRTFVVEGRKPLIMEVKMNNLHDIVYFLDKFGKTVFLTCEEAEAALGKEQK